MSESILLLNPRRRRRRRINRRRRGRGRMPAALRRYWASRRAGRAVNPRRRSRRRRRINRRHVSRRRFNRRRYRATHRRRYNRRSMRASGSRAMRYGRGILGEYVIPGAVGGGGALALDVIWGYLSPKLPTQLQSGWIALAAKLGVVIGVAYGVNRFRPAWRSKVHNAAVGAATVVLYGAIKGVAQSVLPSTVPGLSGYIDYQSYALPGARMGGYMRQSALGDLGDFFSPAAVIQPPGVPVPRQFGGLNGYMPRQMAGYIAAQPHVGGGGGLMGYDWTNDGM